MTIEALRRISCAALLCALLCACAAPPPERLPTPSGQPEVDVRGVSKKQVFDLLVAGKLSEGFRVRSVTEYALVIAKNMDHSGAQLLYGTNFNRVPEARITYNVVEVAGGVRILVRSEIISNPDSPYEKATNITMVWGEAALKELHRIKQMLDK